MTKPKKSVTWRYELGAWLSSYGPRRLRKIGDCIMVVEIERMTSHLKPMERTIMLLQINADISAEIRKAEERISKLCG